MQEDIYEHIAEYLALKQKGDVPDQLHNKVQAWCDASEKNLIEFKKLEKVWESADQGQLPKANIEQAWQNVLGQIGEKQKTRHIELPKSQYAWLKYAAAIVLLLTATAIWLFYQSDTWFKMTNQQLVTAENEKKNITLSDGTKVILNGGSVLYYPSSFDAENRKVLLEGEAFFDVQHDFEQSFTITAGRTETTVLGTEFNLRYYPEEMQIEVFLKDGKVAFSTTNEKVLMQPGEVATFNQTTETLIKSENQDQNITAWQTGKLEFKNTSLEKVIKTLSRFYRTEIAMQEQVGLNCSYTGTFDQLTLEEALQLLQFSADFTFTKVGNKVLLSGELCPV